MTRRRDSVALLTVTALAIALGTPGNASACSCAVFPAASALASAVAVFEGTVVRIEGPEDRSIAVFRVDRVWKGDVAREHSVRWPGPASMCPPALTVGGRFIVYVDAGEDGPEIQACARWAQGDQLAAERQALGPPRTIHTRRAGRPVRP